MLQLNMRKQALAYTLISIIIVISFQNCNSNNTIRFLSTLNSKSSTDDNGYGYGGKPKSQYAQYTFGFNCEGQENPQSEILISTENNVQLIQNNELQCGYNFQTIPYDDLEVSVLQTEVIGYKYNLLESKKSFNQEIPDQLVETWCRSYEVDFPFELIASYDPFLKRAVSNEYSIDNTSADSSSVQVHFTSNLNRLINSSLKIYYESDSYSLSIDRNSLTTHIGRYNGTYLDKISKKETPVECRLGGHLDSQLWPSKSLKTLNNIQYKIANDQKTLYSQFLVNNSTPSHSRLFVTNFSLSTIKGELFNNYDISNFWLLPNFSKLLILGSTHDDNIRNIFSVNFDGSGISALTQGINAPEQNVEPDIQIQNGDTTIFYRDATQLKTVQTSGSAPVYEHITKKLDLLTGSTTLIDPTLFSGSRGSNMLDSDTHNFLVANTRNKICYAVGSIWNNLHCSDLNASFESHVVVDFPFTYPVKSLDDERLDWDNHKPVLFNNEKYILLHSIQKTPELINRQYLVDIDSYQYLPIPEKYYYKSSNTNNDSWNETSFDTFFITRNESTIHKVDFKTWTDMTTQIPASAEISKDGKALTIVNKNQIHYFNLHNPDSDIQLCSSKSSYVDGSLKWLNNEEFLVLSQENNDNRISIYLGHINSNSNSNCNLVNSTVFAMKEVKAVKVSNDRTSLLIVLSNKDDTENLFFVPLNGKPTVQISGANHKNAKINSFDFINNNKFIIYRSNLFGDQSNNLLYFQVPD